MSSIENHEVTCPLAPNCPSKVQTQLVVFKFSPPFCSVLPFLLLRDSNLLIIFSISYELKKRYQIDFCHLVLRKTIVLTRKQNDKRKSEIILWALEGRLTHLHKAHPQGADAYFNRCFLVISVKAWIFKVPFRETSKCVQSGKHQVVNKQYPWLSLKLVTLEQGHGHWEGEGGSLNASPFTAQLVTLLQQNTFLRKYWSANVHLAK